MLSNFQDTEFLLMLILAFLWQKTMVFLKVKGLKSRGVTKKSHALQRKETSVDLHSQEEETLPIYQRTLLV